jgi:hypothetical protein
MTKYLPAALVGAFAIAASAAAAEELRLQPAPGPVVADCAAPAVADPSGLIVLNEEDASPARSYASAQPEPRGTTGPGIDGLRTFYPADPSDGIFGPNPMSQMPVIDVGGGHEQCFAPPPATERPEDIEAANRAGMAGLKAEGPPELAWKGGIESRWLRNQTTGLRPESGEWKGVQLTRAEMWSLKAISPPMPHRFGRAGPHKALDIAAWNNEQVQNLPR